MRCSPHYITSKKLSTLQLKGDLSCLRRESPWRPRSEGASCTCGRQMAIVPAAFPWTCFIPFHDGKDLEEEIFGSSCVIGIKLFRVWEYLCTSWEAHTFPLHNNPSNSGYPWKAMDWKFSNHLFPPRIPMKCNIPHSSRCENSAIPQSICWFHEYLLSTAMILPIVSSRIKIQIQEIQLQSYLLPLAQIPEALSLYETTLPPTPTPKKQPGWILSGLSSKLKAEFSHMTTWHVASFMSGFLIHALPDVHL